MKDNMMPNPVVERLQCAVDDGAGARARIGLLVLESDQTMETEMRDLTHLRGVSVYHSRLANETIVTSDSLSQMEAELPKAARLLPDYLGLRAIGYGCTSGATVIGEDRVAAILDDIHPGVPSTNPLSAAKAACSALGIRRLGLVTPYIPDVTVAMQSRFSEAGIAVTRVGSFYQDDDTVVGRIDAASILEAVLHVGASEDVDGVFVACTSLRATGIVPVAEAKLNKPVTASNHALAWHLLRLAGIADRTDGQGRLFQTGLLPAKDCAE